MTVERVAGLKDLFRAPVRRRECVKESVAVEAMEGEVVMLIEVAVNEDIALACVAGGMRKTTVGGDGL